MAQPLALEGYKKLETAQRELFEAFSACFKKVNGRNVETFQPHEMVMLCNDCCFYDLLDKLREEIEKLTGESMGSIADAQGAIALAEARELYFEDMLMPETLNEPLFRTQFLGEVLVDLQACRMVAKKVLNTELVLELSDKANEESKPLIEGIAEAFGLRVGARPAGKGAYKGKSKGGGEASLASTASSDPRAEALTQVADKIEADPSCIPDGLDHLLYPYYDMTPEQERSVKELIEMFNKEYTTRRKVLTRRLDVTIQAFLWSTKADSYMEQMSQAIAAIMDWRDHLGEASIGLWHMFAIDYGMAMDPGKVSSLNILKSVVKTMIIGAVPDRGGVPEGYTVEDIAKDIVKANVALTRKDQGGGFGAGSSAQAAAAMASKRWIGKGMGSGEAVDYGGGGGGKGGGGGGGYYAKGGGGGGKGGGGGGYYSQQGGGGKGDGGGGGGGYYGGGKGGGGKGKDKGGGGGGGYQGGGGGKGGGGSGGGYYAQQSGGGGCGGGGGFYAQQQQQPQQNAWGGGGGGGGAGGGGGGFYAQQAAGGGGGGGGGFYAQQAAGGGGGGSGGGFYSQQQQGGGGGGGGFYAQQQQQQQGGGGGGFYAQQGAGGGGGGFYAQGGGGGGGGGGGWGGRQTDRPPTSKGWTKGNK